MTTTNGEKFHADIEASLQFLRKKGVVAFPTDTLYGLGADAFLPEAVGRLLEIKGRPPEMGLPILVADMDDLELVVAEVSDLAIALGQRFWPGPLTLVLPKSTRVPLIVTGGRASVAVRMPNHQVPLALVRRLGHPVTGTSANPTGGPHPVTASDVERLLGAAVDHIIDGGPAPLGSPSTILDLSGGRPKLVRIGAVPREELEAVCGTSIG